MKRVLSAALTLLMMVFLPIAAYADAAPLPKGYILQERLRNFIESPFLPIILILVIIAVVILVKTLRGKNK